MENQMQKLVKYQLVIGLNDKMAKVQKILTLEAYKVVENIIFNNGLEGATIFEGRGVYRHHDGQVIFENNLICELLFTDLETVKKIVEDLKVALNQEAIIINKQEIDSLVC